MRKFITIQTILAFIVIVSCKIESSDIAPSIQTRGDSDSLTTSEIIDLIGITCPSDSIDSLCMGVFRDTLQITLPSYPGCTFEVAFEHVECENGWGDVYHLGDFEIISYSCPAFAAALHNAYVTGGSTFTGFVEVFEKEVRDQIEKLIIIQSVPPNTYPCGEKYFFFMSHARITCYKGCIVNQPNPPQQYYEVACGTDCCTKRTTACRLDNGDLYTYSITIEPDAPTCTDPLVWPTLPGPRKCDYETPCEFECLEAL